MDTVRKLRDGEGAPRAVYHSPLRAKQAAATRHALVIAAIALFRDRGWAATTLPMVAAEAGTSVDTIYSVFGSKSGLLMAAIELALAGDDAPTPMSERPELARFDDGDLRARLRTGVHLTLGVYERSVPILKALHEAAASDEAARARLTQYDNDRRDVMIAGLKRILDATPSPALVDELWALVSPEIFTLLTEGRGWSIAQTEEWLVTMCEAALRDDRREQIPRRPG